MPGGLGLLGGQGSEGEALRLHQLDLRALISGSQTALH